MIVVTQAAPQTIQKPRVDFVHSDFDVLIYQKGYEVIWESAIACPCKSKGGGHNVKCRNCGGTGWLFINPVKTKMVLQSLSASTKYMPWSAERAGTVTITARDIDLLADMDRLTVEGSDSRFSQIVYPQVFNGQLFAFTIYVIKDLIDLFVYKGDEMPLEKLEEGVDFTVSGNKILFINKYKSYLDFTCTVRYRHKIQYHVIDLTREVRNSYVLQSTGDKNTKFPVSAIGRRSHYVLDVQNFQGDLIFDNSY